MADLAKLVVKFEAETASLHKKVTAANKKLSRFEKRAKRTGKALKTLNVNAKRLAATLAAGFTVAAAKGLVDYADRLGKLSTRLGISTEALSQLDHAAKLSGISFETLTMGMQRMVRRISEAANGTGEAVNALDELGLSAKELNKLSPDKQFEVLADAIKKVENPADRVRLAMKLFDSEGVALIQTMEGGAEAIQAARKEADQFGLTISGKMAASAATVNDKMTRLGAAMRGVFLRVMEKALPLIDKMVTKMVAWSKQPGKVANAVSFLNNVMKVLESVAIGTAGAFDALGKSAGSLAAAAVEAMSGNFSRAADIIRMGGEDSNKAWDEAWSSIKELWNEVPAKIEQSAPMVSDQIAAPITQAETKVDDAVVNIGKGVGKLKSKLEKAFSSAIKKTENIKKHFKDAADAISAPAEKSGKDLGVFDVAQQQSKAQRALNKGDIDGAVKSLDKAFSMLNKIKEAGGESDIVLKGMANRLAAVGQRIGDENLSGVPARIKLDEAKAKEDAKRINDMMQQYLDQNPLTQTVKVSNSIDPAIVPNVPDTRSNMTDLRPVNVQWPDGSSSPLYGDRRGVDDMTRSIEREALKRGKR